MQRATSAIVICLAVLLMAVTSAHAAYKPPGCFKRDKLEASIKGVRKIPYDSQAPRLKDCHVTQPEVSEELRRAGRPRVAIIVFDVTGSGRVVEQQLVGLKSSWTEIAQKEVAQWLFEPLVEDGIGITRVGVTVVLVAEFEGDGQSCGNVPSPVIPDVNIEIRICVTR